MGEWAQRDDHGKWQQEGFHVQTKKRGLRINQPSRHLNLGLPASRTTRNKFLLFKPLNLWLWQPLQINTLSPQHPGDAFCKARWNMIKWDHMKSAMHWHTSAGPNTLLGKLWNLGTLRSSEVAAMLSCCQQIWASVHKEWVWWAFGSMSTYGAHFRSDQNIKQSL